MQEPGGIRIMVVIHTACRLPYRQKTVESRSQRGPEHNRMYGQQGDLYQGLHPSVVRQYVMLLKNRRCVWKRVQPAASVNIAQGMERRSHEISCRESASGNRPKPTIRDWPSQRRSIHRDQLFVGVGMPDAVFSNCLRSAASNSAVAR